MGFIKDIFSPPKAPKPTTIAPQAPVEEARFKPGGDDDLSRKRLKQLSAGKRRLQIPLIRSAAKKAVRTGRK